ncbi:gp53-like domain-containing protein [Citrobacter amalonaticus]|uniref:gp53-like domain-containing protein n=1 Tax=Citrobacter amalonaticus TaxID=35703 RepID=UPI000B7269CB|nr:carbohydrate-binding protein [Citrobacter amalonaticus]OUE59450.1 hypothetical protein AZ012_003731 [Citrobacter amalonaticus]
MSKIERFQGNVRAFASDAQGMERTVFGGTNQADDLTSQITASFLRGWGIVGASEHPSLEDFNAAMYAMSQFIAYQHQMGVAEWHAQQEYHIGSICTHNGESYQSLQDANIGNEPPSSNWTPVLTSKNGLSNLGLGEAATKGVATNSDMQTGTSTTLLTTVANVLSLFSKKVFGISDYIRIPDRPGGLIIQWTQTGSIGSVNADTTITPRAVTFPIPFPNAALNYIAFPSAPNSTQAGVVPIASELTLTGCNVGLYNSTTTAKTVTNIIVFVVGY